MRIAYHSTGASLTDYALGLWLAASQAALGSVSAPGVLVTLADPKHPHAFELAVLSVDRSTQGGAVFSRILGSVRRGRFDFNTIADADAATWRAWHAATYGGRVPFIVELPLTKEVVIVKSTVAAAIEQTHYKRWQPAPWELVEWAP
jgi:hypothetical protein